MSDPKFLEAVAAGTIEGFIKHSMSDAEAEAMFSQVCTIERQRADQKACVGQSVATLLEALGDDEHDKNGEHSAIGKLVEGLDRHYALEAARLCNPEDEGGKCSGNAGATAKTSKALSTPSTPLTTRPRRRSTLKWSPASGAVAAVLVAEDGEELEVTDARGSRLVVEMQADAPVRSHLDAPCAIRHVCAGVLTRGGRLRRPARGRCTCRCPSPPRSSALLRPCWATTPWAPK
jgi:hypothetical protein